MKRYANGMVLSLLIGVGFLAAVAPLAQTQAEKPVNIGPVLDDSDKLLIQIVALQAQLAQCKADQLDSMKQFTATKAEVVKRIEAKHPGFTLDLNTGKLVAKAK